MSLKINSATIIRSLNCILSLVDRDTEINFSSEEHLLKIFTDSLLFKIPVLSGTIEDFSVEAFKLKEVSSLKASLVNESMDISHEDGVAKFSSNIEFSIPTAAIQGEAPAELLLEQYIPTEEVKNLSKFLAKLSKDNFKGSLVIHSTGFLIPGEYQITELPNNNFPEDSKESFAISNTQLNKILKLGQDICISNTGIIYSSGNIIYQIALPLADRKSLVALELPRIKALFNKEYPTLGIFQPKVFKDFIKSTKSVDRQYDLCKIQTEADRIVLNFYGDKKPVSKFIYSHVSTPSNYIELFVQVKHLVAISELATESISIEFCSSSDPLRVTLDDKYTMYLMQSLTA